MKKILFILVIIIFACNILQSQISRPGDPTSFSLEKGSSSIPFISMPELDLENLYEEDLVFDNLADTPWRFGENIDVNISLENSGKLTILENGDKIWQLGIYSKGALSINLTFNRYVLPKGAELFIYNEDRTSIIGAFTDQNNQDDEYFATTLVTGERIIVDYFEPANVEFQGVLEIETVTHGYRSPFDFIKGFGHSGSCNLNVACPQANDWQDQINSTVLLLVGGNAFCTGSILNNIRQDYTPYVLSANHCYKTPSTVVVWFNWQSQTCSNPSSSPSYQSMSGATQKAKYSSTDFWLFELNQQIPQDYNPYFAGWNRTLESRLDEFIVGVHHPRGDIKKFSYSTTGVNTAAYLGNIGSGTSHWRIVWSGGTTTEPGSSGSPLFDSEGRIIGQLHGGYAACGNTQPDWYGVFGKSWTGGGTESSRLNNWLDPDNTNLEAISGTSYTSDIVKNPLRFKATAVSNDEIMLTWGLNLNNNSVLIAVSQDGIFGQPNSPFVLGEEISGGGRVIYMGNDNNKFHKNLQSNIGYYYKVWSFDNKLNYSEGIIASATTFCEIISDFPILEDFEENSIPSCWKQEVITGNTYWQVGKGNGNNAPEEPYSGFFNIYFKSENQLNTAKLIIPNLNFGGFDYAVLSFYYTNASTCTQDRLKIYYRTDEFSDWILLETYFSNVTKWTFSEVLIPIVSKSTQIAFEATSLGGHGICIDYVSIKAHYNALYPPPSNLTVIDTDSHSIHLTWEEPARVVPELVGYKLYRNGVYTGQLIPENEYTDSGLQIGSYEYFVTALYNNPFGESLPSDTVFAEIISSNPVVLILEAEGNGLLNLGIGEHIYNSGAVVKISAQADNHWTFSKFEENSTVISTEDEVLITLTSSRRIIAFFKPNEYELILTSNPEDTGIQTGSGLYHAWQPVYLNTTVPLGYDFLYWRDEEKIISTKQSFEWGIDKNSRITACFALSQYSIRLFASPAEGGNVFGSGTKDYGSEVIIYAEANEGWSFLHWMDGSTILTEENTYSFTVDSDKIFVAVFESLTNSDYTHYAKPELNIYPNPASNNLHVDMPSINGRVDIKIFNLGGQVVFEKYTNAGQQGLISENIDISILLPGIYIISIETNNEKFRKKLIVSR
ncbi:MAG: T9SS type A sorting domain-containing protein [Bacteroidetes bacterium]|nr:T9SS type A sorting domain-containing protein [Bacteroidota bacterium]